RQLRSDPPSFRSTVARLRPTVVALGYGTNEAFDNQLTPERYRADLDRVLARVRAAAPESDCLLTGPPDSLRAKAPPPLLADIIPTQRSAALAHGCAFWDARAAMGGAGTVRRWKRRGLYGGDDIHLTAAGYAELGDLFLRSLEAAYGAWAASPANRK